MKKIVFATSAALLCTAVSIHALQAAPTKTATTKVVATKKTPPALTPAQQKGRAVQARLLKFLGRRLSSPKKMILTARAGARPDLGQFSEIVIAGRPLILKKKLSISEFSMRARNVRIDTAALMRSEDRTLRTLTAQTSVRAVITESDITSMLARGKRSSSMNLKVRFVGDLIRVSGNWNYGWFSGPVTTVGKLRLIKGANGNQVYFDIQSLTLNGAQVPAFMQNKFSEQLNPLISYDDVPFSPQLRSIRFVGNKAILST